MVKLNKFVFLVCAGSCFGFGLGLGAASSSSAQSLTGFFDQAEMQLDHRNTLSYTNRPFTQGKDCNDGKLHPYGAVAVRTRDNGNIQGSQYGVLAGGCIGLENGGGVGVYVSSNNGSYSRSEFSQHDQDFSSFTVATHLGGKRDIYIGVYDFQVELAGGAFTIDSSRDLGGGVTASGEQNGWFVSPQIAVERDLFSWGPFAIKGENWYSYKAVAYNGWTESNTGQWDGRTSHILSQRGRMGLNYNVGLGELNANANAYWGRSNWADLGDTKAALNGIDQRISDDEDWDTTLFVGLEFDVESTKRDTGRGWRFYARGEYEEGQNHEDMFTGFAKFSYAF